VQPGPPRRTRCPHKPLMAKPVPGKLNAAHDAAVRRMLATPLQPKGPIKKGVTKRSEQRATGS